MPIPQCVHAFQRISLFASVIAFTAFTLTASLASARTEEEFGLIRSEHYNECLEAKGRNEAPLFETCDADKAEQLWFLTRAHSSDHFGERHKRHSTRSVAYPDQCLTEVRDIGLDDQVLELRRCEGKESQHWRNNGPNHRLINLQGRNRCAAVSSKRALARYCSQAHETRKVFDIEIERVPTNFDIGRFACERPEDFRGAEDICDISDPRANNLPKNPHRFAVYALCELQNQNEKDCFINLGDVQQYGFSFGAEVNLDSFDDSSLDGYQSGSFLMDLGDRYSADRCAKAHDRHYWHPEDSEKDKGSNNTGFFRCLQRIKVTTRNELAAVDGAELIFGAAINTLDGGAAEYSCFPGQELGELPFAGRPIDSCHCRLHMSDFRSTYGRWIPFFDPGAKSFLPTPDLSTSQIAEFHEAASDLKGLLTTKVPYRDKPEKKFQVKCSQETLDSVESWIAKADRLLVADRETPVVDPDPSPVPKRVSAGETVWSIWQASSSDTFPAYLDAFRHLNPGVDPDLIYAGQNYTFPTAASES